MVLGAAVTELTDRITMTQQVYTIYATPRSGRVLSRQWTDKKPFSRRVRWYCAGLEPELRSANIRLEFEDSDGVCHKFYKSNVELANTDWERFKQGIGTIQLRNERVDQ